MGSTLARFLKQNIGGFARQCVAFADEWLVRLHLPSIAGNADQFTSSPAYVKFTGRNRPSKGDVAVFGPIHGNPDRIDTAVDPTTGRPIGHVAIVLGGIKNGLLRVAGANYGAGSNMGAGLSPSYASMHSADLLGWVSTGKDKVLQLPPLLRTFLTSPAAQHWAAFVHAGQQYGIDPRLLAAVSIQESGGGRTSRAFLGVKDPGIYGNWRRQATAAAQILRSYESRFGSPSLALGYYETGPNAKHPNLTYAHDVETIYGQLKAGGLGKGPNAIPILTGVGNLFGDTGNYIQHHNPLDAAGQIPGAIAAAIFNGFLQLGKTFVAWIIRDAWQWIVGLICVFLAIGAAKNLAAAGKEKAGYAS